MRLWHGFVDVMSSKTMAWLVFVGLAILALPMWAPVIAVTAVGVRLGHSMRPAGCPHGWKNCDCR